MESIAQWVVNNRYAPSEWVKVSDSEIFNKINDLEQSNKDMLEALIIVKREIEYNHSINKVKQVGKDWTSEINLINNAINKATK